jgi:hypothetical protein
MNLRDLEPGRFADWRAAINEIIRYLYRLRIVQGDGVSVQETPGGTVVSASGGDTSFWAKITGHAEDPAGWHRWRYAWEEVVPPAEEGYGEWTATGRSGTTDENPARNTVENYNSASGGQGNSINVDGLPGSFDIMPVIANTVIVRMFVTNGQYWFQYENAVDGSCPT